MKSFLILAVCGLLSTATAARAADQAPKCADVVAAMELAGGSESAEQVAKQQKTTLEQVRKCWDDYDTARKAAGAASGTSK